METDDPTARMRAAYTAAVLAKDIDALIALYHDDVRVFDLWGQWSYDGREALRGNVADWFGSLGNERVTVEWQDVRTLGSRDIAVLHAFARYTALSADGAALRSMSNRLTWILEHREGAWKISHEHTSAPIDTGTMKAMLER